MLEKYCANSNMLFYFFSTPATSKENVRAVQKCIFSTFSRKSIALCLQDKDLRYLLTDKQGSTLHKISLMYRGNLSLPRSVMLTHEVQKLMNPASVLFPRYWQNCVELPVWEFKIFFIWHWHFYVSILSKSGSFSYF